MKKLIFLLTILLFAACAEKTSCVLAQFPPQIIYANQACQGALPNYVPKAIVTGGCTGFVVTQTPAAGTLLTATNKTVNVTLKATGSNGKSSQVSFIVSLADTITPKITGLTAIQTEDTLIKKTNALYNLADNMTETLYKLSDKVYPWGNTSGSGPSTDGYYDSSLFVTVSMKDLSVPSKPWKRISSLTKYFSFSDDSLGVLTDLSSKIAGLEFLPVPEKRTVEINAIAKPSNSSLWVYDLDLHAMKFWNGTAWKVVTGE